MSVSNIRRIYVSQNDSGLFVEDENGKFQAIEFTYGGVKSRWTSISTIHNPALSKYGFHAVREIETETGLFEPLGQTIKSVSGSDSYINPLTLQRYKGSERFYLTDDLTQLQVEPEMDNGNPVFHGLGTQVEKYALDGNGEIQIDGNGDPLMEPDGDKLHGTSDIKFIPKRDEEGNVVYVKKLVETQGLEPTTDFVHRKLFIDKIPLPDMIYDFMEADINTRYE